MDADDAVIVVGQFSQSVVLGAETLTSAGGKDVFVAKFAATTGEVLWTKRFGGTLDDWGQAVATDRSRNVYITGLIRDVVDFGDGPLTAQGADAFALKLTPNGEFAWGRRIGGSGYEQGFSLVANESAVVIAGSHSGSMTLDTMTVSAGGSPGSLNAFAVALSATTGAATWIKSLGGSGLDFGTGIAMDTSGNVIVSGTFEGAADFGGGTLNSAGGTTDPDIFFVKLAGGTGAHLFSKRIGSTSAEEATAISSDGNNNVIFAGNFRAALDLGCPS
ncbi:MAG: SBBP repeat-containing protein, partial [Kofleriaceae bacterium]